MFGTTEMRISRLITLRLELILESSTIRGFQTGSNCPKVVFYFLQAVTFSWRDPMFLEYAPRLRSASISATVYSCRRRVYRDNRLECAYDASTAFKCPQDVSEVFFEKWNDLREHSGDKLSAGVYLGGYKTSTH
ncbi:hypothetical protein Tco_0129412 [Tanacetum coccineum]